MKALFILSCLFSLSFSVFAQSFGVRIGPNISRINWDEVDGSSDSDYDSKVGIDIAALTKFPLTGQIDLQPELHFIQKGGDDEDLDEDVSLSYLELEIIGRYAIPLEGGNVTPFVGLGPYIGFLVGGMTDFGGGEVDSDEWFESTDVGATLMAGVEFVVNGTPVFIDLRYHFGFTEIYTPDDFDAVNRAFNIGIGAWLSE